jgi:hypothetical protein
MATKGSGGLWGAIRYVPNEYRGEGVNVGVYLVDPMVEIVVHLAPIDYTYRRALYVFGRGAGAVPVDEGPFKDALRALQRRLWACRPNAPAIRKFFLSEPGPFVGTEPRAATLQRDLVRQAEEIALVAVGNAYFGPAPSALVVEALDRVSGWPAAETIRRAKPPTRNEHADALESAARLAESRAWPPKVGA